MQHLLGRATWDADAVHDDPRDYVLEHLRDDQAVLVVDETGDAKEARPVTRRKKGSHTVGVQRQYTGTADRIENAQVVAYLAYAGRSGHAALDRHIPRSWTDQADRCRAAGLDPDTAFATKPELAARMITPASWTPASRPGVAGDKVHGGNPTLRAALEDRATGYVARPPPARHDHPSRPP